MFGRNFGHVHQAHQATQHPEGAVAGADKDARDDMGLGDDVLHIGGFVLRIVTWPVRIVVRAVRRS